MEWTVRVVTFLVQRRSFASSGSKGDASLSILTALRGTSRCEGCGAKLQATHAKSPGFLQPALIQKHIQMLSGSVSLASHARPSSAQRGSTAYQQRVRLREGAVSAFGEYISSLPEHTTTPASLPDTPSTPSHSTNGTEVILSPNPRLVCGWCHSLQHHHGHSSTPTTTTTSSSSSSPPIHPRAIQRDIERVLGRTTPSDANQETIGVCVVDLTDTTSSLSPNVVSVLGSHTPVILIANKVDLLPPDARQFTERLQVWVRKQARNAGLTNIREVIIASATKGEGLSGVVHTVLQLARGQHEKTYNLVVVGATNSGKSSLLKAVVPRLFKKNPRKGAKLRQALTQLAPLEADPGLLAQISQVTVSPLAGTTQGPIGFRLSRSAMLYDTPGIAPVAHLQRTLPAEQYAPMALTSYSPPGYINLQPGKSLIYGGVLQIDHISGPPILLINHTSPLLPLHLTNTVTAHELWNTHAGKLLAPPFGEHSPALRRSWREVELEIDGGGVFGRTPVDICLSGIGWVGCTGKGITKVLIHAPECVQVTTREALLPFESGKYRKYRKPPLTHVRKAAGVSTEQPSAESE